MSATDAQAQRLARWALMFTAAAPAPIARPASPPVKSPAAKLEVAVALPDGSGEALGVRVESTLAPEPQKEKLELLLAVVDTGLSTPREPRFAPERKSAGPEPRTGALEACRET